MWNRFRWYTPWALPWRLDFVSDAFTDGRRFRVLAIVDDYSRECLALVADTSLSGLRVTRELSNLIAQRGKSNTIVSDNGTELTSMAVLKWCQETNVEWHYIQPGRFCRKLCRGMDLSYLWARSSCECSKLLEYRLIGFTKLTLADHVCNFNAT